ncbi:trypsin-like [Homalodisca vitripennis]|uniref:trypsin-like n=1 Tax=Homalodisca vitripennis TaxID=197043 RepID=UPI001EECDAA9|nr:trypsin-like [Homalodisca vitripennis]
MLVILTTTFILSLGAVLGKPLDSHKDNLDIINGNFTTIKKHPINVAFLIENNLWGAGVILNKNWILTTAFNCYWVDTTFISIRVGSTNWTQGGTVFQAEKCILHPQYKGAWDYNIALLKISGSIPLSKKNKVAKAAKLPKSSIDSYNNETFQVSGWGVGSSSYQMETQLQTADQTIWSNVSCNTVYNMSSTSFCAFNANGGPCVFDFGAPLNKNKQVLGIYQGSQNCTNPKLYPALYTDVYQFNSWIKTTIQNNGGSLNEDEDEYVDDTHF